jgi:hypothetical protein
MGGSGWVAVWQWCWFLNERNRSSIEGVMVVFGATACRVAVAVAVWQWRSVAVWQW